MSIGFQSDDLYIFLDSMLNDKFHSCTNYSELLYNYLLIPLLLHNRFFLYSYY